MSRKQEIKNNINVQIWVLRGMRLRGKKSRGMCECDRNKNEK